ncbi:MAG: hypothetical protein D6717_10310 [Gammaproteobacteria bacterium]|nr:MAG: hypothetical protein D6717_10310 [Gammaproteobacteria bacterium]
MSTDKATNPVNVMGASKKLMEGVLLASADVLPVTTARFANVAFSNGSLLAGFLERLRKRQPFSSPKDVRRYFVSPEESGQLCLLACTLGAPGEIFFPKLREEQMMRFSDIAVALLGELGMQPLFCASEEEARAAAARMPEHPREWPVYFFESDTSGEKMYEEFYGPEETVDMDRFHALGVVQGRRFLSQAQVEGAMAELEAMCRRSDLTKADWVSWLERYVPDFAHKETGKSLDAKM